METCIGIHFFAHMHAFNTALLSILLAASPLFSHAFSLQTTESHFPTEPVEGPEWPTFSVYGKGLSQSDVQQACGGERFRLENPRSKSNVFLGCAVVSFALRQCHFVYVKTNPEARQHEKLHCEGLDHPKGIYRGEVSLSQHWGAWNDSIRQETLTLQRRGIPDEDVIKIVVEKAIGADLAVLKRLNWPLTPQEAQKTGWQKETPPVKP